MSKKVYVGLSGGVDSSVSAALLVEQGYDVTGVYMKNWSKDLPGFPCPWKEDYQDAKRVAVKLGIPFELFDFETEYFEKVVQYMIDGYKSGLTPNPDIMCNQEIKFRLFYDVAREKGADFIATGHYAQIAHTANDELSTKNTTEDRSETQLKMAVDKNKDQTYFLYRVSEDVLEHTLFPIGHLTKDQVRAEAKQRGLVTADKKESMGICFVGKVGIREFLEQYVEASPGPIIDQNGAVIGEHDGAIFYTIGQRHGLDVGGGLPYYVTGKDMTKNTVFVTSNINDDALWASSVNLTNVHWISGKSHSSTASSIEGLHVRTRHRAPLADCSIIVKDSSTVGLQLTDKIRAITPGQSAVLYNGDICLGGGIVTF